MCRLQPLSPNNTKKRNKYYLCKKQELFKNIILVFNQNLAIATQTKQAIRFQDGVIS
ncbi:hypothetical protein [Nostoc sp. DedSLP04]|uniref:hypothetical protein n=1 Tax=Nostoc sp. DedSLP04 TaxID=3075401 RepID=UPI002AD35BD6|nr:hypothetical protein [Nostoc sp. DedSLP04]MDZ8031791.1 hypothetical protein [Nostoc sp. DedSLP04]